MKKTLKALLTVIGCTLMITACGKTNSLNIMDVKTDDDVVNIKDIVVNGKVDDDDEEPIITKECETISKGQAGGSLIELALEQYIEPMCTYTCSFSHDKTFSGEYTVKSDDKTIAQVSHAAGTNEFTIKGIYQGDAIITGTTDEDEIVLQFVVHVRNKIPMEKILDKLYETDVYTGVYYNYKLSFLDKDPLVGTLVGRDDFESTYLNFKLTDGVEEKISEGIDFNFYKFKIKVDPETSITSRDYTNFYISTTGDVIYMYYTNGWVDMFTSKGLSARTGTW